MTCCRVRCWRCCSPPIVRPEKRCVTRRLRSRRSSPSKWAWPGCGSRGASSPTWCLATASASMPRHAWPESSASTDGARLMAERGRLFGSLPEGGRMVAVFADAKQVEAIAGEFPRVSVGAYNGPNTVLSGPGEDLEQVSRQVRRRRDPLHVAADQPRLPLGIAGSGARRIRVVRSAVAVRRPDIAAGVQPHGRGAHGPNAARREILAAAFPPTRAIRRKCAHRGGAGLLGIDGARSATGADRGRGAGLARALGRAAGNRLAAQGSWRPSPDRRRTGRGLRRRPPTRFRQSASSTRSQTRVAHLPVPAPPLLAQDVGHHRGRSRGVGDPR